MLIDHELLIFVARSQVNVTECPPNTNTGKKVEEYLGVGGGKAGDPWCAGFVTWCGIRAWGDRWPLAKAVSTWAMIRDGAAKGFEVSAPKVGGVFFVPHSPTTGHVGLIVAIEPKILTVEGNTSGAGVREGWGVFERARVFAPTDRFLFFMPRQAQA